MLRTRVLSVIILLPLVLVLAYLGGAPWLVAILAAGLVSWTEMAGLLRRDALSVYRWLGFLFVPLFIVAAYARGTGMLQVNGADVLSLLIVLLILVSLIQALFDRSDHPTGNWAMTVAAVLYLGFLLSTFVTLRERPDGFWWVLLAFCLTWIIDASAFFVGRAFGRHKWWPRLSPKKTWEGLIGGSIAGLVAAPLLGAWWLHLNPWLGLLLGLLAIVAAPFGDLAESLFKRMAHAKDSGNLIPGHGGLLDRLDSLLFMFPAVTFFALFAVSP